jgi:outer membrane lipoprotein-sorting protein
MPLYLLIAALVVAVLVVAVCAWAGRRVDAEISAYVPPPRWEDHPPP